jgi:hypothetical protein
MKYLQWQEQALAVKNVLKLEVLAFGAIFRRVLVAVAKSGY